jgi:hypothetical protein
MEQYSPEWYEIRKGKFTSSEIHVLLTEPKLKADKEAGELSAAATTYILARIGELMGSYENEFNSQATVWGTEHEPTARAWYSKMVAPVTEVGFIIHPEFNYWGGSPDGLVTIDGVKGGVEFKCPFVTSNHLEHCLIDSKEYFKRYFKEYYWQCVSNMIVTGAKFWDFVSFDPRLDADCGMFRFRIGYDEQDAKQLIPAVAKSRKKMIELAEKFGIKI